MWQNYVGNAVNAVKKTHSILPHFLQKFTAKFTAILTKKLSQLFSNLYWIWFIFTRNSIEVSDSSRSGIRSWRNAGGERFDPVYGSFFFAENTVKISNSPQFTAFTAKRCKKYAVIFSTAFHRISYEKLNAKPRPGKAAADILAGLQFDLR